VDETGAFGLYNLRLLNDTFIAEEQLLDMKLRIY
jgi:hypothetical protein